MVRSFFTFFSFFVCVNSALIPASFVGRDSPSSVAPAFSLPSCAIPCIEQAVASATTCGALDLVCQCYPDNASLIQGKATSCVLTACVIEEALQALDDATAQCSSVLANLAGSASAVPSPTAPSVVSSAAPSSGPGSASAVSSSVPTNSPIDSSFPSTTLSSTAGSIIPSAIPSSIPDTFPNPTFVIPACAGSCIQNAIGHTSCALTDLTCQCDSHNSGIIQAATINCVIANCGDDGESIAVDVQRAQADNCTALSTPPNSGAAPPAITGSPTANGPSQISLTGYPSGIYTGFSPCGPPIQGSIPPYYGYPSGLNPTDPSGSVPTSGGGDPSGAAPSTPTDPGSASSTSVSVDPSGGTGSTPTDPGSASSTNVSVDPSGSTGSTLTDPGSFPSGTGTSTPTDPGSASSTNISLDPSGGTGSTPTDPSSPTPSDSSFPSGNPPTPTNTPGDPPSGPGAASSTYPGDPAGSSSTPPNGGSSNGGPSYGYGYGGYYPSSTPTGGDPGNPSGSVPVSSSATGPASSSGSGVGLPSTTGGDPSLPSTTGSDPSSPSTSGGDPSLPNTTGSDPSSPSATGGDPSSPSTTSSDPSSPSTTGDDPSSPSTTGDNPSLPSTTGGDPSLPSTSGGDPSLPNTTGSDPSSPSTTGRDPSSPSTTGGDPSSPSITGGDPSSPTTSGGSNNPSGTPSGTNPSPSGTNYPPPPPTGYYGYGPPPAPASFPSPSTPNIPTSDPSSSLPASPPFRLTLLPSHWTLLTYAMRVYFNLSPPSPYISSSGLTTNDRSSACIFTISQPEGLLSCSSSSSPLSPGIPDTGAGEARYFGDKFASVWDWGYTVLSTENKLEDLWDKDLNGSAVVDTTSEYPYGSLLRLVNGDFIGNNNQARFCTQTIPSTSSGTSETQPDVFLEGSPIRAYINGTQILPADCKEVKLVMEWVDNDGIGDTPGYA